jgi:pimeloyl-ACP methyl ester carboxylesterase
MTQSLRVGDASMSYSVRGDGPGLLVPWCNFPWPDMPFVDTLADRFTVVLASPRGYQLSTRLPDSREYSAELLMNDLLAVCDHVGLEAFSVLGYSFTAAVAGWLASASSRVQAVVLGGFPLLGSYEAVLRGAEERAAEISRDGETAEEAITDFDLRAVLTFYRELADVPTMRSSTSSVRSSLSGVRTTTFCNRSTGPRTSARHWPIVVSPPGHSMAAITWARFSASAMWSRTS